MSVSHPDTVLQYSAQHLRLNTKPLTEDLGIESTTETGEYIQRGRTQYTATWYEYDTEGQGGYMVSEHGGGSSTIENTILSS